MMRRIRVVSLCGVLGCPGLPSWEWRRIGLEGPRPLPTLRRSDPEQNGRLRRRAFPGHCCQRRRSHRGLGWL